MQSSKLLTTRQAAEILGIHAHTLTKARCYSVEPKIPFVRVGAAGIRYRPEDVQEYIETRTQRPDAADAR